MKKVNLLSRAEMKKVMGGSEAEGSCLYCQADNVAGNCWYRKNTTPAAQGECEEIYPNGINVTGSYSGCFGCVMN